MIAFSLLVKIQDFFTHLDGPYIDLFKILAGCIGWIGGLTLFMWWKEKKQQTAKA
jgi:hypothetical protein